MFRNSYLLIIDISIEILAKMAAAKTAQSRVRERSIERRNTSAEGKLKILTVGVNIYSVIYWKLMPNLRRLGSRNVSGELKKKMDQGRGRRVRPMFE